ncbi:MAG TPA: lysylphosphatidylglycerol synthase transmembrane domain-containing protein [Kofleriaceae bacterium]|nr:lysylphosphatidylglycerol synthase transmembrane domain-containing protein [Kofleriaceae bacterium]
MERAQAPAARPTWAKWITWGALAIALVALVFTIRDVGVATLGMYLSRIGWWWIAVVLLESLNTVLHATALCAFAAPDRLRLRSTLLAQLAGRAVNAVTPSGNLGELVKMSVLTEVVTPSRAVATVLLYNTVSFILELGIVAIGAALCAICVPLSAELRWLFAGVAVVSFVLSLGLYLLVRRGMLASLVRVVVKLRLMSEERYAKLAEKLHAVDDKLRLVAGASRRDRAIGIIALATSRLSAIVLSMVILHAVGKSITVGFVALWTVGSFPIYLASTLVPMGLGVSEGGYYGLFRSLGYNPATGVTLVIARRCITIMYAAIGLVLVMTSETVQRAKQARRAPAAAPADPTLPLAPLAVADEPK